MSAWPSMTLGDLTEQVATVDPRRRPNETFKYVDVSSVSNRSFTIEAHQILLGRDAPSRARRQIRSGDVLFATIRPTLQRIAIVPPEFDGEVCSTGYFVFRPTRALNARFLFYFLLSDEFTHEMERIQTGASYPAVNDAQVRNQTIPLPPLAEQKKIITVLDSAFGGIARVVANAERNLENSMSLKSALLDKALSGKLTGKMVSSE